MLKFFFILCVAVKLNCSIGHTSLPTQNLLDQKFKKKIYRGKKPTCKFIEFLNFSDFMEPLESEEMANTVKSSLFC